VFLLVQAWLRRPLGSLGRAVQTSSSTSSSCSFRLLVIGIVVGLQQQQLLELLSMRLFVLWQIVLLDACARGFGDGCSDA